MSYEMESSKGKALADKCELPDFSQLVQAGFVERLEQEFPDLPKPVVQETPIKVQAKLDNSTSHVLVLWVYDIQLYDSGLQTKTNAKMIGPKQQVIWQGSYTYDSTDFPKPHSASELAADNGKLLREELAFAAEKTVSDLIEHLKANPSTGQSGKQ